MGIGCLFPGAQSSHDESEVEEEVESEAEGARNKRRRRDPAGPRRTVKFTDEEEDEAKEFLILCPGLYNKRDAMWALPEKKVEAWERLAQQLGVTAKNVATWYKTLRKDLGKLRKKYRKSGQGGWSYHSMQRWNRWEFLMPFVHEVNIRSTPSVSIGCEVQSVNKKLAAKSIDII
jgi:hypothetical protein